VNEEGLRRLREALAQRPAGLATDFDGTVSQIVSPPEAAVPLPGAEAALRRLVGRLDVVALVSGRAVADLGKRIDVPGAVYVGLHGLEWAQRDYADERPRQVLAVTPTADESSYITAAGDTLKAAFMHEAGVRVEDKGLGVAVHYRDAPDPLEIRPRILKLCTDLATAGDGAAALAVREGKLVVELGLSRGTDKGQALRRLVEERGLRSIAFFGDDVTDMDGFRALGDLREHGIVTVCVVVATPDAPSRLRDAGDVVLTSPHEAVALLEQVAAARP
jgi:trehalose 6-phosphate phosphatase